MRPVVALLAGVLVLAGCSGSPDDDQTLPDVTLLEFGDEQPVELASMRGPMVVNLWASYCKPCREEMPVLERFHREHGDDVEVVGINYQDPQRDKAEALVESTGVTYRLLADVGGDVNSADPFPNIQGLPFLVLVDEEGRVAHMEYGEVTSVGQLEGLVDEHLGIEL